MIGLLFIIPLVSAFLCILGISPKRVSIFGATLSLILAVFCSVQFHLNPNFGQFSLPVLEMLKIHLSFGFYDEMSVILTLLSVFVCFAAVQAGSAPEGKERLWYGSINFIVAGAVGAFTTLDLFFFYAFHELALIPTFLMIGLLGRGDKRRIAWQALIYLALGSIVLLAGLLWLVQESGANSFAFDDLLKTSITGKEGRGITLLLLLGFGTLVSLFPFHSWAAPAYASAPAPVAMLHAGVLKKFGLYGLFRLYPILHESFHSWLNLLVVLLLCNILWVGFVTLNQKRLDDLLGNSSVMHMGYIFLAFAILVNSDGQNQLAIPAASLLMFGHGISIALLFYLINIIDRRSLSLDLRDLGGIATVAPKLAFWFGVGAMASIGLPGFANFAGELMIFIAGFQSWEVGKDLGLIPIATILALCGVVISAVYMLRAIGATFHGKLGIASSRISDLTFKETVPAVFLAGLLLWIGFFPNTFLMLGEPDPHLGQSHKNSPLLSATKTSLPSQ